MRANRPPKLAEAEVLFFGLIQSGAVKLEPIPMPKSEQEVSFINDSDPEVVKPLEHNLEVLASLYEHSPSLRRAVSELISLSARASK